MKLIEILNQIPKIHSDILVTAPKMDATKNDVYDFLKNSGIVMEIKDIEKTMERLKRLLEYYNEIGVKSCSIQDEVYSKKLKELTSAPAVIYYRGNISELNEKKLIAVIGTRKPSKDGEKISYNLGNVLSQKGYGVVNGLALGCDTYALKGCIDAKNTYPVAVMPCGLDEIYPKRNEELADEIIKKGGCLISEYEPNTAIQKYMYIQRDRIQAGLSDGVIMVEAMMDSGTMHTIDYAKQYGRYIACYKEKNNIFTGNAFLLKNGIQALENDEDLKVFENNINNRSFHQVSLFE